MMINKRLIQTVSQTKKYIAGNIAFQWVSLLANIGMIFSITNLMQKLYRNEAEGRALVGTGVVVMLAIFVRYFCTRGSARMGYLSSKSVKKNLRGAIYQKLLQLGSSYHEKISTSEVVQVAVEGVDQLEIYFGSYLPQFVYSMLAPLLLFGVLSFVNLPAAVVLLVCVPLIPVTIAGVQTFAKKLLARYWGQYTTLGDTFLENLQGLTTLKIYQADGFKQEEMNRESENFRKITMKVLTMQLNSVTVMDVIAFGGAALGIIMAVTQYQAGAVSLAGCLAIILLSADFFIPMRQLGSFFHIAMNGMAASEKIFRLLDLAVETKEKKETFPTSCNIQCKNLHFSYEKEREILHGVNLSFEERGLTAIVGESGCGKSTVAALLMGRRHDYEGELLIGSMPLREIKEDSLLRHMTYVSFDSYLFKGTVREQLLMGNPHATEEMLWWVLDRVKLAAFLRSEKGLDTVLSERAGNLSGGQRQRLSLARALLHDSPVYIFDEATSNIDVDSENEILEQIGELAKKKMVIMITHRLVNAVDARKICVMQNGTIVEEGRHWDLLQRGGCYAKLWQSQCELVEDRRENAV